MGKYSKPYSFEWWLALYDCAIQERDAYYLNHQSRGRIPGYTRYEELRKWIRKRVVESHHDEISEAIWEYH